MALSLGRSLLFYNRFKQADYNQLLTVFVCARYPIGVIDHLKAEELDYQIDPATPWLVRSQFGKLKIAFVICRFLPLEPKYYRWLLFAPSDSAKWEEFVKMLVWDEQSDLLHLIGQFRLKELVDMTEKLKNEQAALSPKKRSRREIETLKSLERLLNVYLENGESLSWFFSKDRLETWVSELNETELDELAKLIEERRKPASN